MSSPLSSPTTTPTNRFDVVVIGAGLAGLYAARKLKRAGVSVAVLEARSRVGGRVHSERVNDHLTIDLGAQFIGDSQRRLSALVDEIGLTRVSPYTRGKTAFVTKPGARPVLKSGDDVPLSLIAKLDAAIAMWRVNRRLKSFRTDLTSLDSISAAQFVQSMTFLKSPADFLTHYGESEMCTSLTGISAYELLDQLSATGGFDGEQRSAQWYLAEGAGGIAEYLAAELGDSLVLNSSINHIEQTESSVTVTASTGQYHGRYLIVAIPPQLYGTFGLLHHLSPARRAALTNYQHGKVIKNILVFERPWWRDLGVSGRISSPDSFFNSALDTSPADASAGVLVLFATASSAAKLCHVTEERDRIAKALEWLTELSGFPVPPPITARSIDWNSDPLSRGGYASRRALGSWASAPDLFSPTGRIHFAGTETATEWRSFMEGALESAERAVEGVVKRFNQERRG